MNGGTRSLVAVLLLAVVGAGLGFAAAAAPVGDTTADQSAFDSDELAFGDEVDRTADVEYEAAGETDERELQATSETPAVDSSLKDATGETVVILDVERDIDVDAAAAGDATSLLQADSAATLEPVATAVDGFEAATVRNEIWVGNLLSVEIDLDTHDAEELAEIDGVERVVPNVEFEHPSASDVSTDETVDLAVVGSTIQEDSTFGMDYVRIFLDETLGEEFNVEGVHPEPDDNDPGNEPINETMDQYDAFVVNTMGGLDSDAIMDSFLENLEDQPVVYLDQGPQNADAIEDLGDSRGDPGEVTEDFEEDDDVEFVEIDATADHPIFTGVADEGERFPVYAPPFGFLDYVTFDDYDGEILGDIAPEDGESWGHAVAVDDDRDEALLSVGHSTEVTWADDGDYTESAEVLLTNAVEYIVTGEVTPPGEEPIDLDLTYGLEQIDIPGFEDEFDGERGGDATVAIVDDGLSDPEEGHPDLDIAQQFLVQDGEVTEGIVEPGAHGEHVAGTATGAADPVGDVPRYGVAPEAELIKIDSFGDDPGATFEDIALGLELSADEGADVAGFSLGAANPEFEESTFEPSFTETVEDANAAGTVVTVSSGNEGSGSDGGQVTSPGTQFDSFTVGASNEAGDIAGFSSGAVIDDDSVLTVGGEPVDLPETFPTQFVKPDVSAAGAGVLSSGPLGITEPDPNAEYSFSDGTSMAQPHVAGAVALLQSLTDEQVPVKQIESALAETAERPADAPGATIHDRNIRFGTGIINVTAAGLALQETQTITGTVTSSETGESIVGATVETDDGALTTTDEDGEFTLHTTSDPAEVTADEFGFAPETQTVSGGETVDFELGTSVEVELVQGQPFAVAPGESFDIIVDVQDLEALTVELTEASDIGPDELTLLLGDDEVPLGETVEFDEPVSGEVVLTVETDAGIEQGSEFGLVHTFAGLGEEITVETGPTTVDELTGPDIELSDLDQPEQLQLDELIESTVTATNVGDEPYDGAILQILRGDFDGDGEETIISIGPQDLQLEPGESTDVTDDLLTFEDINAALPDIDFEVGDEVPTGFQVATEEALEDGEMPFFEEEDLEDELLEDITIVDDITGPFFQVSDLDAPAEADPGETIDVSATVTNIGDEQGTQDVEFVFDGDVVDEEPLTLDPDEDDVVEFQPTLPDEEGIFEHGVFTDDDEQTADITVGDVEEPVIELVELDQPDELDIGADIISEITVENTGGATYEGELLQATNLDDTEPVGAIAITDDLVEVSIEPGEEFTTEQNLGSFADINGALGTDFGPGDVVETGYQLGQNLDFTEPPDPEIEDIFSDDIEITGDVPELVIESADAPAEIDSSEDLEVDFVVENIGEATGSTFVDLFVDAQDGFADFENVEVDPGETAEGTLVFDDVEGLYDPGDTIQWTVELFDFDDSASGETDVVEAEPPEIELSDLSIAGEGENATVLEGDHEVTAEMAHVGGGAGEVETTLTIGDTVEETATVDIEEGETVDVSFEDVTTELGPGVYDVEMTAQDETLTGELTISVDIGDDGTPATDTTGDGLLNDLTGDGQSTIVDVQVLFENLGSNTIQDNVELFDFAGNDRVSVFDVQALFTDLE